MRKRMRFDEHISLPAAEVYRGLLNLTNRCRWVPNFVGMETDAPGVAKRGTRFRQIQRFFGRDHVEDIEVLDAFQDRLVRFWVFTHKGPKHLRARVVQYRLHEDQEGCRVILTVEAVGLSRAQWLLAHVQLPGLRKRLTEEFAAFRQFQENPESESVNVASLLAS